MPLEDEIKLLVTDLAGSGNHWSGRCPEDLQVTAFVDGAVDTTTRQKLEKHFADCARCREEIAFLARAGEWSDAENPPPWLLKKAENLVAQPKWKPFAFDWRWATATVAVSFAILFVVLFAVRLRSPNPPTEKAAANAPLSNANVLVSSQPTPRPRINNVIARSSPPRHEPSAPLIRNSETANGAPNLLVPRDGSLIKRGALTFRWQAVPDVAFYEISIMSASGDVVVSRQTETPSVDFSGDIRLQASDKYFVSVRAYMRDGRTIRSSIVSFQIID